MVTKYAVVQYLPRPLSDEKINVGVVAWREGQIAARFVQNWRRVRAFGREDVEFLRDFASRIISAAGETGALPGFDPDAINETRLEKIIGSWTRSIQFSEPKSSLKSPSEVLDEISSIFLLDLPKRIKHTRSRREAAALAVQKVFEVLKERNIDSEMLKRHNKISGHLADHIFDVVVGNGTPFFAAQGLSFEGTDSANLQRDVDATAWAVDDVRRENRQLPLAVLALPPRNESKAFDRAEKIFKGLDADLVLEAQMGAWATRNANAIPKRFFLRN